jgi:hypothetical protein
MALGPQKQKGEALRKQAEVIIDELIRGSDGGRVTIDTSLLPTLSAENWAILFDGYIKAGWKSIDYVTDQRDGNYLDLQPH